MGIFVNPKNLVFGRKAMSSSVKVGGVTQNKAMKQLMGNKKIAKVLDKKAEQMEFFRELKSKESGGGVTKDEIREVLGKFRQGKGKSIDKKEAISLADELIGKGPLEKRYIFSSDKRKKVASSEASNPTISDSNATKIPTQAINNIMNPKMTMINSLRTKKPIGAASGAVEADDKSDEAKIFGAPVDLNKDHRVINNRFSSAINPDISDKSDVSGDKIAEDTSPKNILTKNHNDKDAKAMDETTSSDSETSQINIPKIELEKNTSLKKLVIGLIGEKGAGKGTVSDYLVEKYGAVHYGASDILRKALADLNLPITRENLIKLAIAVKENFGPTFIIDSLITEMEKDNSDLIIADGIRMHGDVEPFIKKYGEKFHLVYVSADVRTRYERTRARGQNDDEKEATFDQFLAEESEPTEVAIREIGAKANFKLNNNGTPEDLRKQADQLMVKIL